MAELHRSAHLLPFAQISPLVHRDEGACRAERGSFYDREAQTFRAVYPLESYRFWVQPDEGCEGIDVQLQRFPETVEEDGRQIPVPYKGWLGGGCGKYGRAVDSLMAVVMMCALIDRAAELGATEATGDLDHDEPPGFMVTRNVHDFMWKPPALPDPLRGFETCRSAVRVLAELALQRTDLPETARTRLEAFLKV